MRAFVDGDFAKSVQEAWAGVTMEVPMGRLAQPREIAKALHFLASDDASFAHGSELLVKGGVLAR